MSIITRRQPKPGRSRRGIAASVHNFAQLLHDRLHLPSKVQRVSHGTRSNAWAPGVRHEPTCDKPLDHAQQCPDNQPHTDCAADLTPRRSISSETTDTNLLAATENEPTNSEVNRSIQAESTLAIEVFGPGRIWWNSDAGPVDITARIQPRGRELLILLALYPDGITREKLIDSLWGDQPSRRPLKALWMAISRLNRSIAAATNSAIHQVVAIDPRRYYLIPTITTDYQRFAKAVQMRYQATNDSGRLDAHYRIVDIAGHGVLIDGFSPQWVTPIRETVRRDIISAARSLATTLFDDDPQRAYFILESIMDHDPLNELLWRDMLRLHAKLHQFSAIKYTMSILTHKLAAIGEMPTQETQELAEKLKQQGRSECQIEVTGEFSDSILEQNQVRRMKKWRSVNKPNILRNSGQRR